MSDLSVWVPVTDTLKLDPGFVLTDNVVLVPGPECLSRTRIPASLPNATLTRPHWVSELHQSNSDAEWDVFISICKSPYVPRSLGNIRVGDA